MGDNQKKQSVPVPVAPVTPTGVTNAPPPPPAPLTPAPQAQTQPEVQTMDLPDAMRMIKNGKKVKRLSWSSVPDYAFMKDGWLTVFTKNSFHTWSINDGDIEGMDWVVVEQK